MSTESGAVGLAFIGNGWRGNVLAAGAAAGDSARIVSCFARTRETRDALASKHGCRAAQSLEDVWSDTEVEDVVIATPHSVRVEVIEQAAAAGKHIFVEKPLALTGAEARTSATTAEVSAVSKQVSGRLEVDDVTPTLFELESGPLAYLVTLLATAGVNTVTVYGSGATAWTEEDGTRFFLQKRGEPSREEIQVSPIDTVADKTAEFARCIRTRERPETGPEAAMSVVDVLAAIIESSETGRSMDVSTS